MEDNKNIDVENIDNESINNSLPMIKINTEDKINTEQTTEV